MTTQMLFKAVLTVALLGGCASVDVPPIDEVDSAEAGGLDPSQPRPKIVNGRPHSGDPAVVYLDTNPGNCTGALIAPKVVLTAKHCINGAPVEDVSVGVGSAIASGRIVAKTRRIIVAPGPLGHAGQNDLALLILDRKIDLTPYRWVQSAPTAAIGTTVSGIGYGLLDIEQQNSAGPKRRSTAKVTQIHNSAIQVSALGCYGDSGGPLFLPDGRIWGVLATFAENGAEQQNQGSFADCDKMDSVYTRTDRWAALIRRAITESEAESPAEADEECAQLRASKGKCTGNDGQLRRWCDRFGAIQTQHCLSEAEGALCQVDQCGNGAQCCNNDGLAAPDPACEGGRTGSIACSEDGRTLIECDAQGRRVETQCAQDMVCQGSGCEVNPACCPVTSGPRPAPGEVDCGDLRMQPYDCGDDNTLIYCDDNGRALAYDCDSVAPGTSCALNTCTAGPWCCAGPDRGVEPVPECEGKRDVGVSCGGAGGQTLRWCDADGQPQDYDCGADGRVCGTNLCTEGAWCCDAESQVQNPCAGRVSTGLECGGADGQTLTYCDENGRLETFSCSGAGYACATNTCADGPWCCAAENGGDPPPQPNPQNLCQGRRNTGLGCGGADGHTLVWCDEQGQQMEYSCSGDGQACVTDQCAVGPWCCDVAENPGGGAAENGPDPRCNGLRDAGLGCRDNSTLVWCDQNGRLADYQCAQDGRMCAIDSCTSGAWCCDPVRPQPGTPGGGGGFGTSVCSDQCQFARDGECDDGGPGSMYGACAYGSDCSDCGQRDARGGNQNQGGGQQGGGVCNDTCDYAYDGECDDGGAGAAFAVCAIGSDCGDCGPR